MRILCVVMMLLCGNFALAACPRPTQEPAMPDGATADEATMMAGRAAIQAYVNQLEAYRACLQKQVEEATPDIATELKATWLAQADSALDHANLLANRFSAALKIFKERSPPPQK